VQIGLIGDDGSVLFPTLIDAYVDGALARCIRDDEFVGQAGVYAERFQNTLTALRQGLTSVSGKTAPSPAPMAA